MQFKKSLLGACLMLSIKTVATPLMVADFENYPVGTRFTLWNSSNQATNSTATVEIDPTNANNKVLHIVLKDWGTHPEFSLSDIAGVNVTNRYRTLRCRYYRSATETDAYKQFAIFLGSEELYRDESYPYQGDAASWQTRNYSLTGASASNTSNMLRLGIHHANSDYYLDDIQLVGEYDDYVTVANGSLYDFCENNSSSSYKEITTPLYIGRGIETNVRTSRYSNWTGGVAGEGRLNIYAGGERSYIGKSNAKNEWLGMTGSVHLYPYKEVCSSAGFYGLIFYSGTFMPDNLATGNPNRTFVNSSLTMHNGTTIALESGTRGLYIGELQTEAGSRIIGYYKSGKGAKSYYVIGGLNTNSTLAGEIDDAGNAVGLIKIGTGAYTLTGNTNTIGAGITVNEGSVLFANDAVAAKDQKLVGPAGSTLVTAMDKATIGGNGSIGAPVKLYGTLAPGCNSIGTLTLANYKSSAAVALNTTPSSKLRFTIGSASNYDRLVISGNINHSKQKSDFQEYDARPRVYIELTDTTELAVGDEFTLITAAGKNLVDEAAWNFDIRYPKAYTWEVEERQTAEGYALVARVTSLTYTMQGEIVDNDEDTDFTPITEDGDADSFDEPSDATSLRNYAERLGKRIGVAAASYRYNVSDDNDAATRLVGSQFNLIVAENEMKFDATEPSQGHFDFGGADAIMALASRNNQVVRGHTLAWHSQVAGWVSQDGKKNNNNFTRQQLQQILKNHIETVVGRYKGRIVEWDVVNEVLDDDQSIIRTNPSSYKLRPSIWATYIGEDFIDSAFVWAHRVDPQMKLYINDYGVEFKGDSKTEAYYNLIKRLKNSGIPIDGCGLQCHITTGQLDTLRLSQNMKRYEELGMNCIITELDIALANPSAENALAVQAAEYAAITKVFLTHPNCPEMLIWGISDNNSWRQNKPLLYSSSLQPKPAYYGVHAALRRRNTYVEAVDTPLCPAESTLREQRFYTMDGVRVNEQPAGLSVLQQIFSNGTVKSQVVYR